MVKMKKAQLSTQKDTLLRHGVGVHAKTGSLKCTRYKRVTLLRPEHPHRRVLVAFQLSASLSYLSRAIQLQFFKVNL